MGSAGIIFLKDWDINLPVARIWDVDGAHFAKVHRLDTLTTQSRTNRGTGAGLTGADDQLDELVLSQNVACHGGMLAMRQGMIGVEALNR